MKKAVNNFLFRIVMFVIEMEIILLSEKNLRQETLKANRMENIEAIIYQITNGKNGMPAFGGRFKEKDIEKVADYILKNNF
jgi:hypothetical protein